MTLLIIPPLPSRGFHRTPSPHNRIGFCRLHQVGVSRNLNRKRKCVDKGCVHFRKDLSHPRWQQDIRESPEEGPHA